MTTTLEGGEGSASRPGRSLPPRKNRYPLYRRLDGPRGRSGEVRKISPPTEIRSPDRPDRNRLRYPAYQSLTEMYQIFCCVFVFHCLFMLHIASEVLLVLPGGYFEMGFGRINHLALFIYLFLISSTCFGRCLRPSSGAFDCIYSF